MHFAYVVLLSLAVYVTIGIVIAHRFLTVGLEEIWEEELDESVDGEVFAARKQWNDEMGELERLLGRKGMVAVIMAIGMLLWFPIVIYYKAVYLLKKSDD